MAMWGNWVCILGMALQLWEVTHSKADAPTKGLCSGEKRKLILPTGLSDGR